MPDPQPLLLETEDVQLLTRIGFIAAGRADVKRAEVIFGALSRVRPERAFAYVGLAVACLNAGRAADAVAHLEKAQPAAGEEADMVRAFLGLSLQLDARASEATRVLRQLASTPNDTEPTEGAALAKRLLGEVTPAPATFSTSHQGGAAQRAAQDALNLPGSPSWTSSTRQHSHQP